MKRAAFFLVLCAMLVLSLTACGTKPAANHAAGNGTSVTDSAKARTRAMMDEGVWVAFGSDIAGGAHIAMPNVIVTSHQAYLTREALDNIASTTVNNIRTFFAGELNSETEVCYHCARKEACRKERHVKCF